jgi:alpha-glucosidase
MENELSWPINSVVYHIYVRSFKDTNNDGIGDLAGVIQKLDYIKDLQVNAIWLSPIYPSPQADFGYDVSNYTDIDSLFGTLNEFDQLVLEAHKRNLRVMMDYVPNHTSDQHAWFVQSRATRNDPKRDYYIWRDGKEDGSPPNNWLSVFGGSAWEFDERTNQYYLHTFDSAQPDLNWRNPEVVLEMLNALRFWMERGVDGFRVDVPYHMYKDPEFGDEQINPNFVQGTHSQYEMLLHTKTAWLPESIGMMKQFVEVIKEKPHKFMVTEAWTTLPELIRVYKEVGWKYFQPFNFSLITLPWQANVHKEYIDTYETELGDTYIPCWVLGNHDTPRVATRIGESQARIAAILSLTLRGFPFVYYGDEIGMPNGVIPYEMIRDPFEKKSPGLSRGRDPERTPMQWDASHNAGFSSATPWLPISEGFTTLNVEAQEKDSTSMLSLYKRLIALRSNHEALSQGIYKPLPQPAHNVFSFIREYNGKKVLIVLNFDDQEKLIHEPFEGKVLLHSTILKNNEHIRLSDYRLQGNEGFILEL